MARDKRPGAMPPDEDQLMLKSFGLLQTNDHTDDYVRYRHGSTGCGILYAAQLPIPWGVYWGQGREMRGTVWAADLPTALAALVRLI